MRNHAIRPDCHCWRCAKARRRKADPTSNEPALTPARADAVAALKTFTERYPAIEVRDGRLRLKR